KKITSGTKEWADHNVNLINGCSHDCKYCYAKKMAIRFGRKTEKNWKQMEVREHDVNKGRRRLNGRIMFPTSHDLVPAREFLDPSMEVLKKLLVAGNDVLVTTKPHLEVIEYICDEFSEFKDQIQFRFTITSNDDKKLRYWEPGAPSFKERHEALQVAFQEGYRTSVSIEPCLEPDPTGLINSLKPHVTESIWLGSMNYCGEHDFNSEDTLRNWIKWYKDDVLVRFKDSIKKKLKLS
ncbi:MAG: radical SAM protein, partial [Candidatus Hodarchaeota archaeon]